MKGEENGTGASVEFATRLVNVPANKPISLFFTNKSTIAHNLKFDQYGITKPIQHLDGGRSAVLHFDAPRSGSYRFLCTYHGSMEGTLVVK